MVCRVACCLLQGGDGGNIKVQGAGSSAEITQKDIYACKVGAAAVCVEACLYPWCLPGDHIAGSSTCSNAVQWPTNAYTTAVLQPCCCAASLSLAVARSCTLPRHLQMHAHQCCCGFHYLCLYLCLKDGNTARFRPNDRLISLKWHVPSSACCHCNGMQTISPMHSCICSVMCTLNAYLITELRHNRCACACAGLHQPPQLVPAASWREPVLAALWQRVTHIDVLHLLDSSVEQQQANQKLLQPACGGVWSGVAQVFISGERLCPNAGPLATC